MIVFKSYHKIMRRNGLAILIYLLVFSAIAVGIALSGKKEGELKRSSNIKIGVINLDDGAESGGLADYLKENFNVLELEEDEVFIKESLISGYLEYVLKIEKGGALTSYAYSNATISILVNEKIREYLNLNRLLSEYKIDGESTEVAGQIMDESVKLSFDEGEKKTVSESFKGYFTSLSYILSAILMMGIYIGKAAFYERRVKHRIGISGESMRSFNLKLIFSSGVFVLGIWAYFTLLCAVLFGAESLKDGVIYMYAFGSFVFLVPTAALSYLVALLSKNANMSTALMNMITLPSAFLSGVFVPRELLPAMMEKIAIFSPMYWATRVYENILEGNFFARETVFFLLVELVMGILFLSAALVLNRNRALKEA